MLSYGQTDLFWDVLLAEVVATDGALELRELGDQLGDQVGLGQRSCLLSGLSDRSVHAQSVRNGATECLDPFDAVEQGAKATVEHHGSQFRAAICERAFEVFAHIERGIF